MKVQDGKLGYAVEKLAEAVRGMACSNLSINDRLCNAYLPLSLLREEGLPEERRKQYRDVIERLTCVEAIGDEGNLKATTDRMDDEEARDIAYKIVEICFSAIAKYYDDSR